MLNVECTSHFYDWNQTVVFVRWLISGKRDMFDLWCNGVDLMKSLMKYSAGDWCPLDCASVALSANYSNYQYSSAAYVNYTINIRHKCATSGLRSDLEWLSWSSLISFKCISVEK